MRVYIFVLESVYVSIICLYVGASVCDLVCVCSLSLSLSVCVCVSLSVSQTQIASPTQPVTLTLTLVAGCPADGRNTVGHTPLTILDSMSEVNDTVEARKLLEESPGDKKQARRQS